MTRLSGGDRKRNIRADRFARSSAFVARESARKIDREHRSFRCIHDPEQLRQRVVRSTAESDAEHGVHDQIRLRDQAGKLFLLRKIEHRCAGAEYLREHIGGVLILRLPLHEQDRHGIPFLRELARDHKAVAAVFAFAAQHDRFLRFVRARADLRRTGAARVLHQPQKRHACFRSRFFRIAHLQFGKDFHAIASIFHSIAYICSECTCFLDKTKIDD